MKRDPALLLDVSRLISRLGGGPATGIDRVEAEWLAHLQGRPHLLLCRVPRGQLLLPPPAGAAILRWLDGGTEDLPAPGLFDRLRGRRTLPARAGAALRRMALRCSGRMGRGLGPAAQAYLDGAVYLNVGHANLRADLLANLRPLPRAVMIHDTIPLDHPEFTRAGQSDKFRARFSAALGQAEVILTVSEATRTDVLHWRERLGLPDRAKVVATPIGTRLAAPDPAHLPADLDLSRPFFVTLGTIEPRKNHALLLDVWQMLERTPDPPQLFIIGRRGWENREVFARLDRLSPNGPVRELSGLDDAAVAELIRRSHGLLMPSRAEGFGLPLTEAAGRGVPVLATPLPAAREMLGDYAIWLSPDAPADWAKEIARLAAAAPFRLQPLQISGWERHFSLLYQGLFEALRASAVTVM
ncbi:MULTISPECIES: glycosyltransferase family 4 protein [unclassified Paracoccus (in: a-proteobacteria)]|uniref:glycosyltransferase family 4 protein n=1 Tax=unclassified Paracoccus (in: a-proteobacteria) TaxID=2688777 RepID=UPI000225F503|nr:MULTISPECIES: glycosyltransferase family 1 protein [unclassified Paracoccus (in: a-proteobacteria)]SMG48553.1 Glycosyl transferases group 1 [Paracoccus sp. J56]